MHRFYDVPWKLPRPWLSDSRTKTAGGLIDAGSLLFMFGGPTSGAWMEIDPEWLRDAINPCRMPERPTRAKRDANRSQLFFAL